MRTKYQLSATEEKGQKPQHKIKWEPDNDPHGAPALEIINFILFLEKLPVMQHEMAK
jgi:hypothetical protein